MASSTPGTRPTVFFQFEDDMARSPIPGTQVLRRSAQILRLMALHAKEGIRVVDVTEAMELEPPTAHRLLQGLVQERLAEHEPESRRYFLGPSLYELGLTAAPRFNLLHHINRR